MAFVAVSAGYSVAVAVMEDGLVYFSGAPRYKHTGLVLAFQTDPVLGRWTVSHRVHGVQVKGALGFRALRRCCWRYESFLQFIHSAATFILSNIQIVHIESSVRTVF